MNMDEQVLKFLVTLIISSGYNVNVLCKDEALLLGSIDVNDIMGDAYSVEECKLELYDNDLRYCGMFYIVYNGDGSIICDYSDNIVCGTFYNEVCAKFDL